jgi:16S rRNA (uracil1498-N3)-methyltransferase
VGLPRFFAPHATESGATIDLPEEESTHVARVLRLAVGAHVRVFDGRGHEWDAMVHRVTRHTVAVTLQDEVIPRRESGVALTLAIAVLKGDKMDDIIRDAIMLGVIAVQPLVTMRTEVSAATVERSRRVERWRRVAVSSAKQCGRAVVPSILEATTLPSALDQNTLRVMLVEPAIGVTTRRLAELPAASAATLLVGPEGGWTPEEVERADGSGAILITLGSTTLRADAVPLVALTALRVRWDDF